MVQDVVLDGAQSLPGRAPARLVLVASDHHAQLDGGGLDEGLSFDFVAELHGVARAGELPFVFDNLHEERLALLALDDIRLERALPALEGDGRVLVLGPREMGADALQAHGILQPALELDLL
ncbi:MAG: hypothetical protein ACYSX0_13255 [Planctomycetota bacterium]